MVEKAITIYDVAREADVSMATVSRVVNGNTNVREVTRKKVQKVIDDLGYHPNAVARGLASRKTTTVGVLLPSLKNLYFGTVATGIDDVAKIYKYNIFMENNANAIVSDISILDGLLAKQVDGIIIIGQFPDEKMYERIKLADVPVVLAGAYKSTEDLPSVNIDYAQATKEATTKLLENNGKIALIVAEVNGQKEKPTRITGFKEAFQEAGLESNEADIFTTYYDYEAGYELGEKLVEKGYTAAITPSDLTALGIVNYLNDHQISLPEDFEIISSSSTELAEIARPQITSIDEPVYDIGAVAMRMLTKMMFNEKLEETQVILPHNRVKRATTK